MSKDLSYKKQGKIALQSAFSHFQQGYYKDELNLKIKENKNEA